MPVPVSFTSGRQRIGGGLYRGDGLSPAVAFRLVHRGVGGGDERFSRPCRGFPAVRRAASPAPADARTQGAPFAGKRDLVPERGGDAFADGEGFVERRHLRTDDEELVAADPPDDVDGADRVAQAVRDDLQEAVAGGVSEPVV